MLYCVFADSRRGCTPRRAMVRGLQLGSWGRGAWNLVFNHITRDGEPAGARRGLRGRHRRAPREPAPQAGPRRINSSCAGGVDPLSLLRRHFRTNERFSEPNDDRAHGLHFFLRGLYSPCGVRGWPTDGLTTPSTPHGL